VQPNARENKIERYENGILHLKIAAPPIKGKANKEVISFLTDVLMISKVNLEIVKGETNKKKLLIVNGLNQQGFIERIEKYIKQE
ncbi:MAG: DUF167 family protein, partial [Chloroflexi bacterium]|nr:DUF167 family protein [Chloroflexota bacterium]